MIKCDAVSYNDACVIGKEHCQIVIVIKCEKLEQLKDRYWWLGAVSR